MSQLRSHVSLKPYNSFGIDVAARWWLQVNQPDTLRDFLMDNAGNPAPLLLLGGGSNMLFRSDFPGVVIKLDIRGLEILEQNDQFVWLKAGAGENWHELVQYAVAQNWGGIENLSLIPGMAGAAPIQNIGAYGVELKDVFDHAEVMDLRTGAVSRLDKAMCRFGYRDSIFKRAAKGRYAILSIVLRLSRFEHQLHTGYGDIRSELAAAGIEKPGIADISRAVIQIRQQKLPDPAVIGNAGSFFKNPVISAALFAGLKQHYPAIPHYPQADGMVKIPAGWLIETCGWKGRRTGACGVHEKQALVLVNYGGASGYDIYELSERILREVEERFAVVLEREVQIVG